MSQLNQLVASGEVTGTQEYGDAKGGTPYLAVSGLTKRFGAATVVDNVTFVAEQSEFVCVLGPSGCGKTTLLRLIAGFEQANAGCITQDGRDITQLQPEARDFGIVFQSYALFPNRTAAGNVGFGLEATAVDRSKRSLRVATLLELVGLTEHAGKYPSQLSGGQQQRVALARALALSPGLLLLDEPLSALDANVRAHLRGELLALQRRVGVTALMVTHDQQEALSIADRIVVMNKGRIEQSGPPSVVYERPANVFVGRFLGGLNAWPIDTLVAGVATAGGLTVRLDAPPEILPSAAHLCIRPASVHLGREAVDSGGAREAVITRLTFLGDLIRLTLRLPGPGAPEIVAEALRSRLGALPQVGEAMPVTLPPRHLLVLAGES